MSQAILAGLSSALFGLSVSGFALWLLVAAQLRIESLERRILGRAKAASFEGHRHDPGQHQALLAGIPAWSLFMWPVWLAGTFAGGPIVGSTLAVLVGLGYLAWLTVAARRRRRVLVVAVQALIRDLHLLASSGDTAARCLRLAADRCPDPLRGLLRPALLGIQAGQSIHDAVTGIRSLTPIPEYMGLVQALWLHLETGASLSSLLAESADRADEAALLRSETDSKLSEARSTARILAIVPLAVTAYLIAFNRAAIMPLVRDPAGKLLLAVGAFLWLTGVFTVWRMQLPPAELGGESQ